MKYEVTVTFSEELIRRVTRRFLWRFLGVGLIGWILTGASFFGALTLGLHEWWVAAGGTVFFMATAVAVGVIVTYHRRSLGAFRKMESPTARFAFDDDSISVESDLGAGSMRWHMVEELWRFPEAWLIFVAKGHYSTLPTEGLDEAVKDFIVRKVKDAGAKVR